MIRQTIQVAFKLEDDFMNGIERRSHVIEASGKMKCGYGLSEPDRTIATVGWLR